MEKNRENIKIVKKPDLLPAHWYHRKLLNVHLLESDDYRNGIKKGLPFFNLKELTELENKYKSGITWNEIDIELSKKGMIFKKSNFRKYIQEGKIPKAKGYRANEKGREALYPSNIIEHINCIHYYYRIAGKKGVDLLMSLLNNMTMSAKDAIEEQLGHENLYSGVLTYLKGVSFEDDNIEQAIRDVLDHDPEFMKKVISGLSELCDTFDKKYSEWAKMLKKYEFQISNKK